MIADFTLGQDRLNLENLGITTANFGANVSIVAVAAGTQVNLGADSITLVGVADPNSMTFGDFILVG
ncbi:calcium-binding protein, partial [Pseudomonas sp. GCM10022186]